MSNTETPSIETPGFQGQPELHEILLDGGKTTYYSDDRSLVIFALDDQLILFDNTNHQSFDLSQADPEKLGLRLIGQNCTEAVTPADISFSTKRGILALSFLKNEEATPDTQVVAWAYVFFIPFLR